MLLPTQNKHLAREYFESLPQNDENRDFYNGQQYHKPTTFLGKLRNMFKIENRIETLEKFYPYQKTIKATKLEYTEDKTNYIRRSLLFTVGSWALIFNFARRGYVAPLFREYGRFIGTHRVFRHYTYGLVLPFAFSDYWLCRKYYDHIETLWITHANRLNKQILEDPQHTYYPANLQERKRNVFVRNYDDYKSPQELAEEQAAQQEQE